jgi:CheY-like chemotaxis protein
MLNTAKIPVCSIVNSQAVASNGLEAVSQRAELNPDLEVLDVTMPDLDGSQAGKAIHLPAATSPMLLFTQHEFSPQLVRVGHCWD